LHVNSGEFSTVCFCLLGWAVPAQPKMGGPGPAQPKK
jgi:hypothetical protein